MEINKNNKEIENIQLVRGELMAFTHNKGLDRIFNLYGISELPTSVEQRIQFMSQFAEEHWDFRQGAERQETDWNDELLDSEGSDQWNTIFEGSDALGMIEDSKPKNTKPDALVVLGGANRSPLDRLNYGLESVEDFGLVAYLGSSRPLSDAEKEKVKDYAPGAETEFDLGCGAIETLPGAHTLEDIEYTIEGQKWKARLYEFEHNGRTKHAFVLNTPYKIGERRATTADNYALFAKVAELDKLDGKPYSVVSVTTGLYVPAQNLKGVGEIVAKYGVDLETIGHSARYTGVSRKPKQLLQEIKAAIDAASELYEEVK